MLATLGSVPAISVGYSLEFKHDGQHATMVPTTGGGLVVLSQRG